MKSNDCFPTIFNDDFRKIINHEFTEFYEYGGRGSCKSSFLSCVSIVLIISDPNYNMLVLRKVENTLRDSVYEQLIWAIDKLGLNNEFTWSVSPLCIKRKSTGQKILFRGADKAEKLKSIKLNRGYFAITWFEELTEFTQKDVYDIKLSTMRGGSKFWVFYSFNPPSVSRNWCNQEVIHNRKDRFIHLSDYRTVPIDWLGEAFIREAEELKRTNPRSYRNIFLGEATGTGRNVFENIELRTISQKEIDSFEYIYNGVDFGYFPDPFVYQKMAYDMKNETLYIFAELKLFKHGNYEASEKLKDSLMDFNKEDYEIYKKIHRNYSPEVIAKQYLLEIMNERITADSAEPKSVADFRNYGWNMKGAVKGKGSLEAGFKWLQSRKKIVIDPVRCPEAADEFSLYEYDIDKRTGEIMEGYPQGQKDHSLAACRYAMEEVWNRKGM